MATPVSDRVQKHRDALRTVQIWVPGTRRPDFAEECRRQAALIAAAEQQDAALHDFMDAAAADLDGWS